MTESFSHVESVLAVVVGRRREAGTYRANRRIFTDEAIFELEMKHLFEDRDDSLGATTHVERCDRELRARRRPRDPLRPRRVGR